MLMDNETPFYGATCQHCVSFTYEAPDDYGVPPVYKQVRRSFQH